MSKKARDKRVEEFEEIANRLLTSSSYKKVDDVNDDIKRLFYLHEKLKRENATLRRFSEKIFKNRSTSTPGFPVALCAEVENIIAGE